jgi:hypothetical protein
MASKKSHTTDQQTHRRRRTAGVRTPCERMRVHLYGFGRDFSWVREGKRGRVLTWTDVDLAGWRREAIGMGTAEQVVPARFLATMAHLVAVLLLLWSKVRVDGGVRAGRSVCVAWR